MAKTIVEECLTLDVNRLSKIGALGAPGIGSLTWTDGSRVGYQGISYGIDQDTMLRLTYSVKGEPVTLDIDVERTPMPNGGHRRWFRCPVYKNGSKCDRRVAKLHMPWYSKYFACRICHDLVYRSQQVWIRPSDRPMYRYFNRLRGF